MMKALMLISHERSITQIKYNLDGDLLFSVSKSPPAMVWRTDTGMRIGTYEIGEKASIYCLDINNDTTRLVTGSAGNTIRLWDCETGACLQTGNYSLNYDSIPSRPSRSYNSDLSTYL